MNIIEVENLEKSYGKVRAVDGISFAVERGCLFSFLCSNDKPVCRPLTVDKSKTCAKKLTKAALAAFFVNLRRILTNESQLNCTQ